MSKKVEGEKTKEEPMKVWNAKIVSEEEKVITVKDIELKVLYYKTSDGKNGIRVPLEDNGELMDKFAEYCETLKDKLSERELRYNLIQFSTFGENDKGLDFFAMIGFYVLNNHVIFSPEPDAPSPLQRLTKWVEYYKTKFNIQTKPKKDVFNVLGTLDLTEE